MAAQEIHIKEEPIDSISPEAQVEPLYAPATQLQIGVHHRLRNYGRSASSSSPETFVCEVCQGEFLYQDVLQKHKLLHFNTRHVCYSCDCYFINTDTLLMHMSTIHSASSVVSQNHKGEIFVCTICLQRFSSSKILQKHENLHAVKDEGVFNCKICAMDFLGYKALLAHLNSPRHRDMKVKIQSIFVCVDCRAIFASRDSYAMHMMVRAQNETCDSKSTQYQLKPNETAIVPKSEPPPFLHSPESNGQILTGSTSLNMNGHHRSPSPLNLSTQPKDLFSPQSTPEPRLPHVPASLPEHLHFRGQHKCPRCNEQFTNQDALAMHFMLHAKTEAEDEHETSIKTKLSAAMIARTHALLAGSIMPRTTSLPVIAPPHSFFPYKHQPKWSCTICQKSFESCDTLAMHVMDRHTNSTSDYSEINMPTPLKVRGHSEPQASTSKSGKGFPINDGDFLIQNSSSSTFLEGIDRKHKRCRSLDVMPTNEAEPPSKRCHSVDDAAAILRVEEWRITDNDVREGGSRTNFRQEKESSNNAREQEEKNCKSAGMALNNDEYLQELEEKEKFKELYAEPAVENGDVYSDTEMKNCLGQPKQKNCTVEEDEHQDQQVNSAPLSTSLMSGLSRRSKRKQRAAAKFVQPYPSPQPVSSPWDSQTDDVYSREEESTTVARITPNGRPSSRSRKSPVSISFQGHGQSPRSCTMSPSLRVASPRSNPTSGASGTPPQMVNPDMVEDADLLEYILQHVNTLAMCRFCGIIFTDRTMYYLHMGLHNVNNPWQCNLCGKVCSGVHQFSSHVIHY